MPPSHSHDTPNSKRGREDDASPPTAEDVGNLREELMSQELMCGICHELVVNATQTPCCGGLWCRECIEQVNQRQCPACRAPYELYTLVTDARSERLSASLKRSCKHHARGCPFRGNRSDVKDHEPNCPHLTVAEVRKDMEGQMATLTANMQGEIDDLSRQLTSARMDDVIHYGILSQLRKENDLLSCDHVFSFRLHPENTHTQRCSVQLCNRWLNIDVEVKCNDDNEVSLYLFRPTCHDTGTPGWKYINDNSVSIYYTTNESPGDVREFDITPPVGTNWSNGNGYGRGTWLTNYDYGSLIIVGISAG